MDLLSIILLGVGLAIDCFAVSVSKGLTVDIHAVFAKRQKPWLMAVLFGLFQGGMPLIGYYAGNLFSDFFSRYAGWIALALLGYIGGKMIYESLQKDDQNDQGQQADFSIKTLFVLAVATSIDALATGVVFIPCPERLWIGVSIIALCSFFFAMVGYLIGVFAGSKFKVNVELIGGIILIIIGLKIFIEGLCL